MDAIFVRIHPYFHFSPLGRRHSHEDMLEKTVEGSFQQRAEVIERF
jgi:hypothetical protein